MIDDGSKVNLKVLKRTTPYWAFFVIDDGSKVNLKVLKRTTPYWAFFVIDDCSKVNLKVVQLVQCILCHFGGNILNHSSSSGRLGIISYDKGHGTTSMKKHVSVHHLQELAKMAC